MHYVPSIHVRMSACQSYAQHTFFCLDFFASICCYIIRIAMCPSTYLSHSYTQCLPCVSVSLSPHLPLILRHYVGIACVQLCSSVLSHSCHILVSTLTVHINLLNCVVTHVSLIARPPGCLFVFCE